MRSTVLRTAAAAALFLGSCTCQTRSPGEPVAVAPAVPGSGGPSRVGSAERKPGFKQEQVPAELNPAKNVRGQEPVLPKRGVAAIRPFLPGRSIKVGQGSLSVRLGEGPSSTLPVTVYHRGPVVVLSADGPDLGVVLTVPRLATGTYTRDGTNEGPGAPNLRLRLGAGAAVEQLQAAELRGVTSLTVRLDASAGDGSVRGSFEGQAGRDEGQVVRKVSAGTLQLRLDPSSPAAREALSAAPAGALPVLRNVASPAGAGSGSVVGSN